MASSRTDPNTIRAASIQQLAHCAERAAVILRGWNTLADRFVRNWAGFNAIYNAFSGTERERLMAAIASGLTEEQAEGILSYAADDIDYFAHLPPGNVQRARTDPHFRKKTLADMRRVKDISLSATTRLSHLLSVVYQVRCNLLHGGKNAGDERGARLIGGGDHIVSLVLDKLMTNAGARS